MSDAKSEKIQTEAVATVDGSSAEHIDHVNHEDDLTGKIFAVEEQELPKGYYRSIYFWGSMVAIGLSLMCGVAGFSLVAPILAFVNADIGPSPYINWVALTYLLTGAVGCMIVGRLSGLFALQTSNEDEAN
jgi:hypothetical protein